ncbi:saccharopine dehydrogenase family protein [Curvibacter sp. PAE-UM]|uniref:saccharopine dehydrogenase family protein n=1 Tax=Curvibacter sp. PAE-UM TaxID=1714344 RepID=UPI00070C7A3A|nr:saccharopine dehydrogenase NADP-binding domain-containing protein [Curvibacter sp. PAE-UM]KRI00068.1 saccharopine dehydrogenase [Curvibacter sp. PAE-UM]
MKTLVLGGYGNFGARICRALAGDPAIQLLVGGRDRVRAEAMARELGAGAQGVAIDLDSPGFTGELRQLGVELLIHTAGPFQQQAYRVAEAAAAAGCHYIDLADGRRFVCDFAAAMNPAFRAAGRVAISGASTVPALSSAVIDHLCAGWQRIDTIDICIAPAQTAPRGRATIEAVLSYCGAPIQVWTEGRWQARPGWGQPERIEFSRLRPRLGALCDIPDLELFPVHYRVGRRVMFRAALEVGLTQRVFAMLARLRTWGVLPQPRRLGGLLNAMAPALDFLGTSLGGMVVRATGADAQGQAVARSWHITADHDHGPEIPCMAAILLARKLAAGAALPVGAHACLGLLKLAEFKPEFDRWGMVSEVVDDGTPAA